MFFNEYHFEVVSFEMQLSEANKRQKKNNEEIESKKTGL